MIAEGVYLLCTLTSLLCAILLTRAYLRSHVPLLFWSAVCFYAFTINNALVFIDLVILPSNYDLSPVRAIPAAIGVLLLCYGLIRESVR
ncbi:MAG TPA: DUF5985 family protein [Candidatus Baltobacteraceae bacterium]|nr:DUF5985 family protein [Candidatus Baltobacteraceae bacterium]